MTDRVKGLVVTLDKDYRVDDVQAIVDAVKMVKGVLTVDTAIANLDDHMNRERMTQRFREILYDLLRNIDKKVSTE
jgi:hypothetical protein